MWKKIFFAIFIFGGLLSVAFCWDKGIYLTQYTLENPKTLDYLLKQAKATGINTFVIDHDYFSSRYASSIAKVKAAGIKNVTRVVVFAHGGDASLVKSPAHWEKIYKFVDDAIKAGSDVIQLDYIRYSSKQPANEQHAKDVHQVIKWFKTKINAKNVPMEIDIFGEVSYHPSMHIGQDIKLFSSSVDGVNPMVYPSHFWPYQKYSAEPYQTVNNSLKALVDHFDGKPPFKIHAFIEAANYHYLKKTSNAQKQKYLLNQIRAVEDAPNVTGWYVWSANNVYENLFTVLKNNKIKTGNDIKTVETKKSVKTVETKKGKSKSKTIEAKNTKANSEGVATKPQEPESLFTKIKKWF